MKISSVVLWSLVSVAVFCALYNFIVNMSAIDNHNKSLRLICDGKVLAENNEVMFIELGFYRVSKDSYFRQMPGTICTIIEVKYEGRTTH